MFDVEGLEPAFYRYLPVEHQLLFEFSESGAAAKLAAAALGQAFVGQSAVTFLWTAIPYRMEWRYGAAAHKTLAIDAGHVCQNLYLAAESIGCGVCAIAAFDDQALNDALALDGESQFAIYLGTVGKRP